MFKKHIFIAVIMISSLLNIMDTKYAYAKVKKVTFGNGLTLLYKETKSNDIVAMDLFVKAGSWYENDTNSGITNLVQQLLLKGTKKRTAEEISYQIESIGGIIDIDTNDDYAEVYTIVTNRHFDTGFDVFFDVVNDAVFPEEELEKERQVILSQINAKEDHIFQFSNEQLNKLLYGPYPYAKSVLGTKQTVEVFNRDALVKFHRNFYTPGNMILVIVGNIPKNIVFKKVKETFAKLVDKSVVQERRAIPQLPIRDTFYEQSFIKKFRQAYIMMGYIAPDIGDKDYVSMKVINTILGSGMNSRLFTSLRAKEGLAYEIGSFYPTRRNISRFGVYAGLDVKNLGGIKDKMLNEVNKLKENLISAEELEGAKNYLKGNFILEHQTNKKQAWYLGWFELLDVGYDYDRRYLKEIEKITIDDIKKAANRYFKENSWVSIKVEPETK